MDNFSKQFIDFTISHQILKFGEFKTKAGRISPYFFNLGLISNGLGLKKLGEFYGNFILDKNISFDLLFGPAYKGISLVSSTAIALSSQNYKDINFAFNRKEVKDHGEGGQIIGYPISGNVLILDDVISAGTAIRESIEIIKSQGGNPQGVVVAIDRQEKGQGELSATEEIRNLYNLNIHSLICLDDIIEYIKQDDRYSQYLSSIENYRAKYGI